MRPILEKIRKSLGYLPQCYFADGGFAALNAIEWAHCEGVAV